VTGLVHPDRILTNAGARPGDALVLTKPLGTGVLFNAGRSGKLPYRDLEALLPAIAALNGPALEAARRYDVHACTDITGFGLLGHCLEMARGSATRIHVSYRSLPFHPYAADMYRRGETTGSNPANRKAVEGSWELRMKLSAREEELLFDPQTSGGLLLAVPDSQAADLIRSLQTAGMPAAARIAEVRTAERAGVSVG
jgi:selenide,water dikinase